MSDTENLEFLKKKLKEKRREQIPLNPFKKKNIKEDEKEITRQDIKAVQKAIDRENNTEEKRIEERISCIERTQDKIELSIGEIVRLLNTIANKILNK